ncbi:MAG: hypothetical protein IPK16_26685 [Anaerolineales bacterium]|nr:hypothetical protein [Anaerolineales bacterium]
MTDHSSPQRKPPFVVTDKMRRQIAGAVAEVDLQQMAFLRSMTPAERAAQFASMNDAVEKVAVFRLRQREPELDEARAWFIVRSGLFEYERQKRRWLKNPPPF